MGSSTATSAQFMLTAVLHSSVPFSESSRRAARTSSWILAIPTRGLKSTSSRRSLPDGLKSIARDHPGTRFKTASTE